MFPLLGEKAAELLAPMAAKLASPWVKWAAIGVGLLILVVSVWWKTYDHMRTKCEQETVKAAQLAASAAMAEAQRQLTETMDLNAKMSAERDKNELELKAALDDMRKKARKYANRQITVPTDLLAIHDQYVRLPDAHSNQLPPSDYRPSGAEVQRVPVLPETKQQVRIETEDGEFVEMTLEEAVNMLADVYDSRRRLQKDYERFSKWNDGREAIELGRSRK